MSSNSDKAFLLTLLCAGCTFLVSTAIYTLVFECRGNKLCHDVLEQKNYHKISLGIAHKFSFKSQVEALEYLSPEQALKIDTDDKMIALKQFISDISLDIESSGDEQISEQKMSGTINTGESEDIINNTIPV